ncbi:MAG: hypothetical protein AAB535_03930, partial [Patescibacteria group bacterium]
AEPELRHYGFSRKEVLTFSKISSMKFNIRLLYLYLFSFIGLLIAIIGTVQLVDLAIKVYVFKGADKYENYPMLTKPVPSGEEVALSEKEIKEQKDFQELESKRQRQRQASTALSMLIVGLPLYKYHWSLIKKEKK